MVSIEEIQAAYYMVAATGVIVAAVFYVLNLRETSKNRRITLTSTLLQPFMTKEGVRDYNQLISMKWTDLEDYKRKYDADVNPENYVLRFSIWNMMDNLGKLYREGLIDLETLHSGSAGAYQWLWLKFKPVIEMYRGTDYGRYYLENFEYAAGRLEEFERSRYGVEGTESTIARRLFSR
jgi:hypothetical protein